MLLSFSEYVNEHFGAITIDYPQSHNHPSIQDTYRFRPHTIGGNYGGNYRIPRHWNDSPILSGGFGGAGMGHFGAGPVKSKYESADEIKKAYDYLKSQLGKTYTSLRKGKKKGINMDKTFEDEVSKMSRTNQTEPGSMTHYEDSLEGEPLTYTIDTQVNPTPGTSGSYFDPPEPGDTGEYTIYIDQTDENIETLIKLGVPKDSLKNIFSIELQGLLVFVANNFNPNGAMASLSRRILGELEEKSNELDELYLADDNIGDRNEGELMEDGELTNGLMYLALKYIILIGIGPYKDTNDLWDKKREIIKQMAKLPNKEFYALEKKSKDIKNSITYYLNFDAFAN
jgi:hypothetical protein